MEELEKSKLETEIGHRQVQILYDNNLVVLIANLVLAALAAYILYDALGLTVNIWLAIILLITLGRAGLWQAYRRRTLDPDTASRWALWFTVGATLSGISWGIGNIILFVPGNPGLQLFLAYLAAGVAAGAVAGLSIWRLAFIGFVTPQLLGLVISLLGQGERYYFVMAAMAMLMWLFLVWLATRYNGWMRHSLKLDLENLALHEKLREARFVEAAGHSRSQFIAAMNHELRTPLNAILGFSEMIRSEAFGPLGSEKYKDYIADIHQSAGNLLNLVNDVMSLSKIESGAVELHEKPVDVAAVITDITRSVQEGATAGGVRIARDLTSDCGILSVDERLFRQVLLILLSNAVKYTPRGGEVMLTTSCREGGGFALSVIDTGPAIDTEDIAKLTADFGLSDSTLASSREGVGFSLSLAKSLVELQGGKLELSSGAEAGVTVVAAFPAERVMHLAP